MLTVSQIIKSLGCAIVISLITTHAVGQTSSPRVVATNLVRPHFIAFGSDGGLYVTEAGNGGTEVLPPQPDAPPGAPPGTRGYTGRLTRIDPATSTKQTVVDDLPSYAGTTEATGPSGLVIDGNTAWVAVGGAGTLTPDIIQNQLSRLTNEGSLLAIDLRSKTIRYVADIEGFVISHPAPAPHSTGSNPFGLARGFNGYFYVADAEADSLLRVNSFNGQIERIKRFDPVPSPYPNPDWGGQLLADPVPTGVIALPGGATLVGLLTGFPFTPGTAKIFLLDPFGNALTSINGLTTIIAIAFGPNGKLYAVTAFKSFDTTSPNPFGLGQVVQIGLDGTQKVVLDNLTLPCGIAFDPFGDMYLVTGADDPVNGQILEYAHFAAPELQ